MAVSPEDRKAIEQARDLLWARACFAVPDPGHPLPAGATEQMTILLGDLYGQRDRTWIRACAVITAPILDFPSGGNCEMRRALSELFAQGRLERA